MLFAWGSKNRAKGDAGENSCENKPHHRRLVSRVFRGYFAVIAYLIDDNWKLHSVLMYIVTFMAPHTKGATASLLHCINTKFNLREKRQSVETDNAAEVCTEIAKLLSRPPLSTGWTMERFHFRWVAYTVNLGVKICLSEIYGTITSIRDLVSPIRNSVKRRYMFESIIHDRRQMRE